MNYAFRLGLIFSWFIIVSMPDKVAYSQSFEIGQFIYRYSVDISNPLVMARRESGAGQAPDLIYLCFPETLNELKLTPAQSSRMQELYDRFVASYNQATGFTYHEMTVTETEAHRYLQLEFVAITREIDADVRSLWTDRQRSLIDSWRLYYWQQIGLLAPEGFHERQKWADRLLRRESDFWTSVEAPSRYARQDAMESLLAPLSGEQREKLRRLVGEEVFNAQLVRNDILYATLTTRWPAHFRMSTDDDPFEQVGVNTNYYLYPNGDVIVVPNPSRQVTAGVVLSYLIGDTEAVGMSELLTLSQSQVEELRAINQRHYELLLRVGEEAHQIGDFEHYRNSREIQQSNRAALQEITEVLLPHQKEILGVGLSVALSQKLGLKYSLCHGALGHHLQLTKEQREEIEAASKDAAERLRHRSVEINQAAIQYLAETEILSNDQLEGLKQFAKSLPENRCPYPEAIIPLQAYEQYQRYGRDTTRPFAPLHLRRLYGVPNEISVDEE